MSIQTNYIGSVERTKFEKRRPLRNPKWFLDPKEAGIYTRVSFFRYIEQSIKNRTLIITLKKPHKWDTVKLEDQLPNINSYLNIMAFKKHGVGVKLIKHDDTDAVWVLDKNLPNPPEIPSVQLITASLGASPFKGMMKMGNNLKTPTSPAQKLQKQFQPNKLVKDTTAIKPVTTKVPSTTEQLRKDNRELHKLSRRQKNLNRKQAYVDNMFNRKNKPQTDKPIARPVKTIGK